MTINDRLSCITPYLRKQAEAAIDAINLLPLKYRITIVEELSIIGLVEYYDEKFTDKKFLTELCLKVAGDECVLLALYKWGQIFALVQIEFYKYFEYHNAFVAFLKENRLYTKNIKCFWRNGFYVYKDDHDREQIFKMKKTN